MGTSKKHKASRKAKSSAARKKNNSELRTSIQSDEGHNTDYMGLSSLDIGHLTAMLMEWLFELYQTYGASFPSSYQKYWEQFTKKFLRNENSQIAWICSARAGSGKSMWLTAFVLMLCELANANTPLYQKVQGGLVFVVQKIETLNDLAVTVTNFFPGQAGLFTAVQSLSASGKKNGLCKNKEASFFEDCVYDECPYAASCPIATSVVSGRKALIAGITQARFMQSRKSESAIHNLLYRQVGTDEIPRRFLFFDERFEMSKISCLSKSCLNHFSDDFEEFIRTRNIRDNKIAALQFHLDHAIIRRFDTLRWRLRYEGIDGRKYDYPYGFCSLADEEGLFNEITQFRNFLLSENNSVPLSTKGEECLDVMLDLTSGECLFVKENGFRIISAAPPCLSYGSTQTLIFDATAAVDGDYAHLTDCNLYDKCPERRFENVTFHLYTHPNCNVSKEAMKSSWKPTGIRTLIEEILKKVKGKVYVCTYKEKSKTLFNGDIPDRICQINDGLPYYGGTNGSNDFRDCRTVVLVGWPRLTPDTFLINCYAAWREFGFKEEIYSAYNIFESGDITSTPFRLLPMQAQYESHYLAARAEQEIYRSSIRLPECNDKIHIYLFCPPKGVWPLLRERFPGCREEIIDTLPYCMQAVRGKNRKYQGKPTAYSKLTEFLESWEGTEISTANLRDQELQISKAVWKDLMKDDRVNALLSRLGIIRDGRGKNAKFVRHNPDTA